MWHESIANKDVNTVYFVLIFFCFNNSHSEKNLCQRPLKFRRNLTSLIFNFLYMPLLSSTCTASAKKAQTVFAESLEAKIATLPPDKKEKIFFLLSEALDKINSIECLLIDTELDYFSLYATTSRVSPSLWCQIIALQQFFKPHH